MASLAEVQLLISVRAVRKNKKEPAVRFAIPRLRRACSGFAMVVVVVVALGWLWWSLWSIPRVW